MLAGGYSPLNKVSSLICWRLVFSLPTMYACILFPIFLNIKKISLLCIWKLCSSINASGISVGIPLDHTYHLSDRFRYMQFYFAAYSLTFSQYSVIDFGPFVIDEHIQGKTRKHFFEQLIRWKKGQQLSVVFLPIRTSKRSGSYYVKKKENALYCLTESLISITKPNGVKQNYTFKPHSKKKRNGVNCKQKDLW